MGNEPHCTVVVEVTGNSYDGMVANARSKAVDFLGDGRAYWLSIHDAEPKVSTPDGTVVEWRGDARIAYPNEPAF